MRSPRPRPSRAFALALGAPAGAPASVIGIDTLVTARPTSVHTRAALPTEWQVVLEICPPPGRAAAEVAARLSIPLSAALRLLDALATARLITVTPPTPTDGLSTSGLVRLRDALYALH